MDKQVALGHTVLILPMGFQGPFRQSASALGAAVPLSEHLLVVMSLSYHLEILCLRRLPPKHVERLTINAHCIEHIGVGDQVV